MIYKVFLSCSEEDARIAKKIFNNLRVKRGIRPYIAEIYPVPGTFLWDRLEREIKNSDCVTVLWTSNGSKSQYVNQEIGAAKSFGKEIIPIVQRNQPVAGAIEGLEWIPYDRKTINRVIRRVLSLKREKEKAEERETGTFKIIVLIELILIFILILLFIF